MSGSLEGINRGAHSLTEAIGSICMDNQEHKSLLDDIPLYYERLDSDDYVLRRIRNWRARLKRRKERKAQRRGLRKNKS